MCVVERYGSAEKFLIAMSPAVQSIAAMNPDEVYRSPYTITKVRLAFGADVVNAWLMTHLEHLNDYTGVRTKINIDQMRELAGNIIINYGYLKAAELLLFFHRLNNAFYGKLYGSVDPIMIASALCQYSEERRISIARIEAAANQKRLDEQRTHSAKYAITREECERRKKLGRRKRFVELSHKKRISILKK